MADTFTTSLSIRQIETGTRSGTWGSETNTQYELLDNAFSYVNHDLASDADATLTISDGTASDARYFYIKFTSAVSLTATRSITLAPDDSKKIWIVENATTGSQSLTFKQGSSGGTVTVVNGNTAVIYADGAGATNGAIINALNDLQIDGNLTATNIAGTLTTAAQTNITSVGTLSSLTVSGDLTVDTSTLYVDSTNNFVGIGTTSEYAGTNANLTVADGIDVGQDDATGGTLFFTRNQATGSIGSVGGKWTSYSTGPYINFFADNVGGGSQAGSIHFYTTHSNSSTEKMVISSDGKVGIGTTSPESILHIDAGDSANLLIKSDGTYNIQLSNKTAANGLRPIDIEAQQLTISTNGAGGSGSTERVIIDDSGNVGINWGAPTARLGIIQSGSSTPGLNITDGGTSDFHVLAGYSTGLCVIGPSAGSLAIKTANTERIRIDTSGNVGIGTTSPSQKLNVNSGSTTTVAHFQSALGGAGNTAVVKVTASGNSSDGFRIIQCGSSSLVEGGANAATLENTENAPLIFGTNGTERMRITGGGQIKVATSAFFVLDATNGLRFNDSTDSFNNVIMADNGNVTIRGALSKGSGSFRIDHPLESKKDTHELVHSFVESPQADNIYRGKVDLVDGSATVNIDTVAGMTEGTFVALNREVQCFTSNESDWDAVKGSVLGNILTIECQNTSSTATVSWLVIGERQDQHMYDTDWTDDNGKVIVEPLKTNEE